MNLMFVGTCSDPTIARLSEKPGRKFNYKKACSLIKDQYPKLYYDLALNHYNPWSNDTKIIKTSKNEYLHINHSQIDYLFIITR